MTMPVAQLIDDIDAAHQEIVALEDEDDPPPPRSGAAPEAIERVRQTIGRELPPEYVGFLRCRDGWPDFPYGGELFGTDELSGPAYERTEMLFGVSTDGVKVPKKLRKALIVGESADGHEYLLLTRKGRIVTYRFGDTRRYADFPAYLAEHLRWLREHRDSVARTIREAQADWDPVRRAARESALLEELRGRTDWPAGAAEVTPPPAADPMPEAVDPTQLVLRADAEDDEDDEDEDDEDDEDEGGVRASVSLSLVLYLGSYPSPDEVLDTWRAFRRHFPVAGAMRWARPDRFFLALHDAPDPDDESWASALRVNGDGLFGLRAMVRTPERYTVNVCGIPPTGRGEPRASFCEVLVPAHEDPRRLAALARELTDLLPVRSGLAGWAAQADGSDDLAWAEIFRWCRRFFGLDAGYQDGWLEGTLTGVVGAGWLTVLGPTLAMALAEREPLRFSSPDITVDEGSGGVIITAGPGPTLGDVHRGEFPVAVAEVERHLRPLKVTGWHRRSTLYTSGTVWDVTESHLPGGFADHRMTGAWLDRLTNPAAFLGPTPRERGVELLERLHAEYPGEQLQLWREEDADGDGGFKGGGPEGLGGGRFIELLRLISAAALADVRSDTSLAALEFVTSFGKDTPTEAYNNLIHVYWLRGQIDDAARNLATALKYARKNPYLMHNAACVLVRTGDTEGALKMVRRAKKWRYELFDRIRTDEDLRVLWDDPRFIALFDDRPVR